MDAALWQALESIERRIDELSRLMKYEWNEAGRQRDLLGNEIDALAAELALLRADLNDLRKRQTMTPEQRQQLLGQDLTKTIDEINTVVRGRVPTNWANDVDLLFTLFGNFWAHTLGQATVMAAGAVRAVDDKATALEGRVAELERQVGGHDKPS